MKRAHTAHKRSTLSRAKDFRDGLIIALLAARPLRLKNFTNLRLGQHLKSTSEGYLIVIPGEETKTGCPIETFATEDLCTWLSIYLKEYRPQLLCGRQSDFLWIHAKGAAYRPWLLVAEGFKADCAPS